MSARRTGSKEGIEAYQNEMVSKSAVVRFEIFFVYTFVLPKITRWKNENRPDVAPSFLPEDAGHDPGERHSICTR